MAVEISGLKEFEKAFKGASAKFHTAFDNAVRLTADKIMGDAIESIDTQVRGNKRVRRSDKNGRTKYHYVSPPGGPPNTDTGNLTENIFVSHIPGTKIAYVYTPVFYGAILETINNRPWLEPAMLQNSGYLIEMIAEQLVKMGAKP